jgi:subtilisin family serine protease
MGLAAAGGLVASATPPAGGEIIGADSVNAIPNSYIVALKPVASGDAAKKTRALIAKVNVQAKRTYSAAFHGFAATMSPAQARQLAADPDVAFVQQNQAIRIHDTQPNPPSWGLDRVDQRPLPLDNSYTYATTASNVHAYVIDTGIRFSHNDYVGRAVSGVDTIDHDGMANDCDGHGTHVAGTIGGTAHGVAKGVTLVAVRVLDCSGSGDTASVVEGVDWVTAHAIKPAVANMSLGGEEDAALELAVGNSIASGITYAVSAGNSAADACSFSPAGLAAAITVGATDRHDNRASFSNFGTCVDTFAPGVGITSSAIAGDSATAVFSGTSMASPHVAGAAALVLAANPSFTPAQVTSFVLGNATPSSVVNRGPGSFNRLLYTGSEPTPPAASNDFDLLANDDTVVTVPGSSGSTFVQVPVSAGTSQTVTLSALDLPAGVTASFSPASLSTGGSFTATFNASGGTTAGRYAIAVNAAGTTVTHRLSLTLVVSDNKGTYYPVTPSRILDTRTGNGAPAGIRGPNSTLTLQVSGRGDVPASGVSAVVLNVTATGVTGDSFVTVYPTGVAQPLASSLNLVAGWTGANSVTVQLGSNGQVNLFNAANSTHLIADVVGFYSTNTTLAASRGVGGEYQPVIPGRLFDSRFDFGEKVPGGSGVLVGVSFGADVDKHIRALVVNVTAVDPEDDGFVTTWSGIGAPPLASTLNYKRGDGAVPNMAVVPVGTCCGGFPAIGVFTQRDSHIIVDLMGFVDDSKLGGLRFTARTPVRITDTRPSSALGPATTRAITAPGTVAPAGTDGLALNVTAVQPTATTFLSVWPAGIPGIGQPLVSNLNPNPGQIIPNSVYTLVGPTKAFNVYNNVGTTHLVVDVVGTFWDPLVTPGGPGGLQAALSGQQPYRMIRTQSAVVKLS